MNKYAVELIGTFFLVLTVGLAAGAGLAGDFAPFAIGLVLISVIYAGGHVSAAHYNPAVTLAFWLRGRCPSSDVLGYVVGQLLGTALAAGATLVLADVQRPEPAVPGLAAIAVAEVIFTFALTWVILNVATAKGTEGNGFYGLAIGAVVIGGIFTVGPISGAVFNPAVALGLCLLSLLDWSVLWLYVITTSAGAALAAVAFRALVTTRDSLR